MKEVAGDARRAAVVTFFRTIELFSPQRVPKIEPHDDDRPCISVAPSTLLPWAGSSRRRVKRGHVWQHTVYLGLYEVEETYQVLLRVFEPDVESYDERPAGTTALAAFRVTDEGTLMAGSELVSSCAWAVGRTISPGPGSPAWLRGLDRSEEAIILALRDSALSGEQHSVPAAGQRPAEGDSGRSTQPLTVEHLGRLRDVVASLLGVQNALSCREIRISSRQVKITDADQVEGTDFLNSFIADDLERVAMACASGDCGPALRNYLREAHEIDAATRIDVDDQLHAVHAAVAPRATPFGRWPSGSAKPLALGQQLAVNQAITQLSEQFGLFAVNGPPGTGKTTMLRDLIAAIVVQRAQALANLEHPSDAFIGSVKWKTGDWTRTIQRWRHDLVGHEIVVASANNGAVQNVTDEIPALSAVDDQWTDVIDYFPEIGSALLDINRSRDDDRDCDSATAGSAGSAWALAAGRLENKRNRNNFVSAFWFDGPAGTGRRPSDANLGSSIDADQRRSGMQSLLQRWERRPPSKTWPQAVAEFRFAEQQAGECLRERQALAEVADAMAETARRLEAWRGESEARRRSRDTAWTAVLQIRSVTEHVTGQRVQAMEARREHLAFKPAWWEWIVNRGGAKPWRTQDEARATALLTIDERATQARLDERQAIVAFEAARAALMEAERETEAAVTALDDGQRRLRGAKNRWGRFVPDEEWWRDDHPSPRRETASLWLDEEVNAARTKVYLAALRLHRAFLQHVPKQMRQSLQGAMDVVKGTDPQGISERDALAAWQSLFFVVPVLSTTFASYARVFAHLGRESLGWLFVDEAGQATSQQPVGALWRTKRAVIVGDPLQLEPIVTLPFRAQQAIRNHHGVSERWLPTGSSAQRLADESTPFGTWIRMGDKQVWVGAPLRVHRRCDEPMFGIVNSVAYGGSMISAVHRDSEFAISDGVRLAGSGWIDVAGEAADGNFVHEELRVLLEQLDVLAAHDGLGRAFLISPFRDVARRLETLGTRYRTSITSGTVHRAQGKESEIVFLVLGSNPASHGARAWAARKPNLINVAASRAQRRLYVIGNRRLWRTHQYFDVLDERLPASDGILLDPWIGLGLAAPVDPPG